MIITTTDTETLIMSDDGDVIEATDDPTIKTIFAEIEKAKHPENIAAQHLVIIQNSPICAVLDEIKINNADLVASFEKYKKRLKNSFKIVRSDVEKEAKRIRATKIGKSAKEIKAIEAAADKIEIKGIAKIEQSKIAVARTLKAINDYPNFYDIKLKIYKNQMMLLKLKKLIK